MGIEDKATNTVKGICQIALGVGSNIAGDYILDPLMHSNNSSLFHPAYYSGLTLKTLGCVLIAYGAAKIIQNHLQKD